MADITRIVHIKKEYYDVYIGRPTMFGNPFVIGVDGTREEVIEKYEKWIRLQLIDNLDLKTAIMNLEGKVLGCWCAPQLCHGDILAKLAQELNKEWRETDP